MRRYEEFTIDDILQGDYRLEDILKADVHHILFNSCWWSSETKFMRNDCKMFVDFDTHHLKLHPNCASVPPLCHYMMSKLDKEYRRTAKHFKYRTIFENGEFSPVDIVDRIVVAMSSVKYDVHCLPREKDCLDIMAKTVVDQLPYLLRSEDILCHRVRDLTDRIGLKQLCRIYQSDRMLPYVIYLAKLDRNK